MRALETMNDRSAAVSCLLMGASISLAASSAYAGQPATVRFRKVAETGMAAPGTEPGVVFGALTTNLNHNLLVPRMDRAGRVAFMGLLSGPGIDLTNFQGMWAEKDGTLQLVARNGEPAPGTEPSVPFRGVPNLEVPFAPLGGGPNIAFPGQLFGPGVDLTNDEGIWKGGPGNLSLVAREGSTPPGLPGLSFGVPNLLASGAGHVLLRSLLQGAGVNDTNQEALFSDRSGVLELLLREGQPAPSTEPGTVFGGNFPFQEILFNDDSQLAIGATLAGPAVNGSNDQALYVEQSGVLRLVLREGDPVPGAGPGVIFGGGSSELSLNSIAFNNHERVAFLVRLGGAVPTQTGLFSDRTGALAAVAIPGQPAPGTNFDYSVLGRPVLNGGNQIVFSAAFPDDDGDIFTPPPFGVFSDLGGALALVVSPGDTTPEGETIKDARVSDFNSAGQMLLSLRIDSVLSRTGFWLRDCDGTIHRIAASGDQFDVRGDGSDVREVTRVVTAGMNEAGQVAIRIEFSDSSNAHFVASLACRPDIGVQPGDFDGDGDVDLIDFQSFQICFGAAAGDCLCILDFDLDGDVDLGDFQGFAGDISGPL